MVMTLRKRGRPSSPASASSDPESSSDGETGRRTRSRGTKHIPQHKSAYTRKKKKKTATTTDSDSDSGSDSNEYEKVRDQRMKENKERYGENVLETVENPEWGCPACRGICNCSRCRRAKGWPPVNILYAKVNESGYKSVAHFLIQTRCGGARTMESEEETQAPLCYQGSDTSAEWSESDDSADSKTRRKKLGEKQVETTAAAADDGDENQGLSKATFNDCSVASCTTD